MSHLESIGFKIESSEQFEALMSKVFEEGKQIEVEGGTYVIYTDKSGAELYAQLDSTGEFIGFMPFYDTTITRNLHVESSIQNDDLTLLDKRYSAKSQERTYPFIFDVVNANQRDIASQPQTLPFVAFPTEIKLFASAEHFLEEMPELSATYFVPVGLMTPEGEANENPEPYAMFISEIKSVEVKRNAYSNQDFYVLEVSALEGDLTIVTSIKSLIHKPEVGNFVNGVYWMGAKV
jgi:hypothetical protein